MENYPRDYMGTEDEEWLNIWLQILTITFESEMRTAD
jgi:hypothetical protein